MRRATGLALSLIAACSVAFASSPANLTVFAAASLTDAFNELGATFQHEHPGLRVRFNFAGSQQLALQIEQGAQADLFASADQRWMSYVEERGLLAGPAVVFAHNRLVVIVPRSNPGGIHRLADLARAGIKLVLPAEAVPAGRYSREVLRNLERAPGLASGYSTRVLSNLVSQEENVKAVVAKIQLGEADAGMVYRSDVTPTVAAKLLMLEIPDAFNVTANYPIGVLKGAANAAAARAFGELLQSARGKEILERRGLIAVGS